MQCVCVASGLPWLAYLSAFQALECWHWWGSHSVIGKIKIKCGNDRFLILKKQTNKTLQQIRTSLSLGSSLRARRLPLSTTRPHSSRLRFSSSATLALRLLSSKHNSSSERPVRRASAAFSLKVRKQSGSTCRMALITKTSE